MLALPLHTLQPQSGECLEARRLPHVRGILRQCAEKLELPPLAMAVILDSDHEADVERVELVRTRGKKMEFDDAKYRLKTNIITKGEFLEMTPIAGKSAVFRPMPEKSSIHYRLGATTDNEPISMEIERTSQTTVAINLCSDPVTSYGRYYDALRVDESILDDAFKPNDIVEWRAKFDAAWPITRGLRVDSKDNLLNMVLPPSLVATLLDALMVASGVDALLETHRIEGLPSRPWVADGDVTLKLEPPRVGPSKSISIMIPLHPLTVHVDRGRMQMSLLLCGCVVENHPMCLLCGRCAPWKGDDTRRAAFMGHCQRAGNRCLDRIQITIGKTTGGAWTDKRTCQLCIRDDPCVMALVEAIADTIEFANTAVQNVSSSTKLIEQASRLPPPVHVINDTSQTMKVAKLLRQNTHSLKYDKKKVAVVTDRDGKPCNSISKRHRWLFPRSI